jgi:hypothetical protein
MKFSFVVPKNAGKSTLSQVSNVVCNSSEKGTTSSSPMSSLAVTLGNTSIRNFPVGDVDYLFLDDNVDQGHINSGIISRTFIGQNFGQSGYWLSRFASNLNFSRFKLECVRDQRQAEYSDNSKVSWDLGITLGGFFGKTIGPPSTLSS